tara:strand:- start:885 stop:1436 length:552 start_codon:yes stop_codon:yes gene_type:complete
MYVKRAVVKVINISKNLTLLENISTYARVIMTTFIKKKDIKQNWLLIDGENLVVGRLAVYISKALRGKLKTTYTPSMDNGDFVIVTNVDKIKFTGKKFFKKKYYRHTGHPGGIKITTPEKIKEKKPEDILKLAVKRMLSKGPLSKKQLTKLKMYKGPEHPHEIQNPTVIDFKNLNKKNQISIN